MISAIQVLLSKHQSNGLLIDTNVLLLYFVGLYDPEFVSQFKNTRNHGYTADDVTFLRRLVALFRRIVTTPHILAELSNLSMQIKDPRRKDYFKRLAAELRAFHEEFISKDTILDSPQFAWLPSLGFTDMSVIVAAARHGYLVLTDDLKASAYLRKLGRDVINLNEIRGERWLLP